MSKPSHFESVNASEPNLSEFAYDITNCGRQVIVDMKSPAEHVRVLTYFDWVITFVEQHRISLVHPQLRHTRRVP